MAGLSDAERRPGTVFVRWWGGGVIHISTGGGRMTGTYLGKKHVKNRSLMGISWAFEGWKWKFSLFFEPGMEAQGGVARVQKPYR
jgi:hypothetical protein